MIPHFSIWDTSKVPCNCERTEDHHVSETLVTHNLPHVAIGWDGSPYPCSCARDADHNVADDAFPILGTDEERAAWYVAHKDDAAVWGPGKELSPRHADMTPEERGDEFDSIVIDVALSSPKYAAPRHARGRRR